MEEQNIQQPSVGPQPNMSQGVSSGQQKPLVYILSVALVIALGAFGYMFWQNQQGGTIPSQTSSSMPTSIITPDSDLIKQALAKKENSVISKFQIDKQDLTHARGTAVLSGQEAGGWWLATKINDIWTIIESGNGAISCSYKEQYGFSNDMLSDCYDEIAGWKMSSNKLYTIKYPTYLQVAQDKCQANPDIKNLWWCMLKLGGTNFSFSIEANNPGFGGPIMTNVKEGQIVIDGVTTNYKIGDEGDGSKETADSKIVFLGFNQGENEYYISSSFPNDKNVETNNNLVKQILSTFKFIK